MDDDTCSIRILMMLGKNLHVSSPNRRVSLPLVRKQRGRDRDEGAGTISVDVSQEPGRITMTA